MEIGFRAGLASARCVSMLINMMRGRVGCLSGLWPNLSVVLINTNCSIFVRLAEQYQGNREKAYNNTKREKCKFSQRQSEGGK